MIVVLTSAPRRSVSKLREIISKLESMVAVVTAEHEDFRDELQQQLDSKDE